MSVQSNSLRILALAHGSPDEPCTFARIFTPLQALSKVGRVTYTLEEIWPWRLSTFHTILRTLKMWDLVWISRPRHYLMLPIIQEARRVGVPVLVDIDDWLVDRPDSFNDRQWFGTRAAQQTVRKALQLADAVTVSTNVIAQRCESMAITAHVIANAINTYQFERLPREIGPTVIGYCGTMAHSEDVSLIAPALEHLLAAYGEHIRVITFGCPIASLQGQEGYTHYEYVPTTQYPSALSHLKLDIGLAPLLNTSFNQARSDIKYLEYSATGAATVASSIAAYSETVDPTRGVLVMDNTPDSWLAAIRSLLDNRLLRQNLAARAYEWVHSDRSVEATSYRWESVFHHYCAGPTRQHYGDRHRGSGLYLKVFEHGVVRQIPYYGAALAPLLYRRLAAR